MEKHKFSKPVAFNKRNEKDKIMLNHVKRRNFSGYVKKLIWEDIKLKKTGMIPNIPGTSSDVIIEKKPSKKPELTSNKRSVTERIEQLKQQTKKPLASLSPQPFIPSSNKDINQ
ncbi:hypothetical protein [Bacillus pseudomycoides]|uniref:hypothetical protein n=1 Tax=Bacillus pseudomycoides TaxID=64104 RepID=UPI000BF22000|nr:hypothetical protein [Bacillus pseudomycoides]PEK70427.1 hypothetical protein CN593_05260 [Bacillus pseudomycoides]PEN08590.1 hypothetical protein CN640_13200 [Bacillus pseudomycoides]PFZ93736.1 hypothetical protein COL70_08970 [Bacillus pseudomycoides]